MGELNLDRVQLALDRAHRVLWRTQKPDGSWDTAGEVGPWVTAQVVTALRYLGALNDDDTRGAAKWLSKMQRPDGSFQIHPYSTSGDLGSTATAWAALHLCGAPEAAEKARAWVMAHGGTDAVVAKMKEGELGHLFLAMAGLIPLEQIPVPDTAFLLVPPVRKFLETRFHSGVFYGAFETELILKKLRGDYGPDGNQRSFLDTLKAKDAIELYRTFQNENGSWNDSTVISVLVLPALAAAGLSTTDSMLARALYWIDTQKVRDADGMHFAGFGTEVWATAFDVRALLAGGMPPNDPDISRALDWLVKAQCTIPMPRVDNRKSDAVLTGGWAFQRTNHTMPDADDAGVVLTALGMALGVKGEGAISPELTSSIRRSVERGRRWLQSMQNPDGGWSAFVWGLPGKKPGAMMQKNPEVDFNSLVSMAKAVIAPPPVLGDPSTEDLTSRVLHGLGALGETVTNSVMVARAVEFLREQQAPNGAWWGRWVVNYLSASSFVLMGLAAVKVDLKQAWVQRAVRWVMARQNADGGWGEGPESYRSEAMAGVGPTMLPLTALVVQALIDCGEGDSDCVRRAMHLLVDSQRADGTWDNGEYLHTNVPPDTFYVYPEAARFYPTEALGKYLQHKKRRSTAPDERSRWNNALLDEMRKRGDPVADEVIAKVFASGDVNSVNTLMQSIFRTDQPVPAALPDEAERYFQNTALPTFINLDQMKVAQALFTRCGWQIAMGLFCSSLPQAYAAAKGAHVITQTQGMTKHTVQRVFETAQFVFDTMDVGSFANGGRGVRAIQKVRLMHAAVRHLVKAQGWDEDQYGLPINQEDLAGTLMTFSVVTFDGLKRLGIDVTAEEGEAWLHAWKVVGQLLGLRDELLPKDVADGEELMEAIRDRQWRHGPDGPALIKPLITMMQDYFPGTLFDGFPVVLVRALAGDHCADLLGLPRGDWTGSLLSLGTHLDALLGDGDHDDVSSKLFAHATNQLMQGIVTVEREGKSAKFRIPPSLQQTVDPKQ